MCTILILRHVHPDYPLVLAANRDEFYGRPATAPQVLLERPRVVGGKDLERSGTWMGVTAEGFFVGLTNQRSLGPADRSLRSRGEVVVRTLEAGSVEAAERYLDTLRPGDFNAFNLLYGDARRLRVAYARTAAAALERADVPAGVHVLPNDVIDCAELPKVARARSLAARLSGAPWPQLAAGLQALMADHALPPLATVPEPPPAALFPREVVHQLQALCIHTPLYGTRSFSLVALQPGRVAHYLSGEDTPCRAHLHEVTPLLYPAAQA
jgi:uncharacterized protein with NRDE domain